MRTYDVSELEIAQLQLWDALGALGAIFVGASFGVFIVSLIVGWAGIALGAFLLELLSLALVVWATGNHLDVVKGIKRE